MAALRRLAISWRARKTSIGFVPTLGALHEGHLELIRRSRRENRRTVVSVFVNPAQFGPREDFKKYPRPFARDAALCRRAGVDALFAPASRDLYSSDDDTRVSVDRLSRPLCGGFRPGHFRGVATVVAKLFNIVQPDRAYFGEKDFQQFRVVSRLVRDLHFPVRIVPVPTVREPSGLARSSRNRFLTAKERTAAPVLARALRSAAQVLNSRRRRSRSPGLAAEARRAARKILSGVPGLRVQYLEVADPRTLRPWRSGPALVAAAVFLGRTRLIDNVLLGARRAPSD